MVVVYPWLSSLRNFAVEGVDLVLYQVLVGLPSSCCWASGLLGYATYLRSVGVLHQSPTVTLLSLLPPLVGFIFGLSAVPLPQAAAVGLGLCWSARLSGLLTGRCCSFTLGSSSLAWLRGEPSIVFLLFCLPSGCGHPLGSLVSFVTIDRQRRWPLEGFFFCVVDSRLGVLS